MKRILIVDDDTDILKYCFTKLTALKNEVVMARSVDEALDVLGHQTFDLLIIDINMPKKNGFELLKALKQFPVQRHKILMLTGRRTPQDVLTALELGAIDYVCKPIEKDIFFPKVQSLLGLTMPVHEFHFVTASKHSKAWASFQSELSSLSESGLTLLMNSFAELNSVIRVESPVFLEIGILSPRVRVTRSDASGGEPGFQFRVSGSFIGLDETSLRKIRLWVAQQSRSIRKAG